MVIMPCTEAGAKDAVINNIDTVSIMTELILYWRYRQVDNYKNQYHRYCEKGDKADASILKLEEGFLKSKLRAKRCLEISQGFEK